MNTYVVPCSVKIPYFTIHENIHTLDVGLSYLEAIHGSTFII